MTNFLCPVCGDLTMLKNLLKCSHILCCVKLMLTKKCRNQGTALRVKSIIREALVMGRENLTQLLSQLSVQSTQEDSNKVEEICKQLLANGCADPGLVLRKYLVAVIKQDKYSVGLNLIKQYKTLDEKYGEQFILEKLYIYYKVNAVSDFERLYIKISPSPLESFANKNSRGLLHVRAQFCYKQGLYEEAFKIYSLLASHNEDMIDNNLELACNERVPLSVVPYMVSDLSTLTQVNEESYDLLFNDSMILTARGEYNEAAKLLKKTQAIAKREGYESDVEAIDLQLAFVLQMKGDNKASHQLLTQLSNKSNGKTPFGLLAKMNQKSFTDYSKYSDNLNLIIRELDFKKLDSINNKQFTHQQWSIINRNCLFLHLFNNNSIQYGSTLLSRTLHNYSKLVNDLSLESYKTQGRKLYHRAVQMIRSGVDGSVIGFILLSVQMLIMEKQWENAIRLCELYLNHLWKSSVKNNGSQHHLICYILFELYKINGRDHSKSILLKNLSNEKKNISRDASFWKHVGFQHLSLGNVKEARKIFKDVSLYDDDSALKRILSVDELLDVDESRKITQNIDPLELLELGIRPLEKSSRLENKQNISKVHKKRVELKKNKKKEQRVKKFLKAHPVSNKPDPERWISLKDRASYKPQKKQSLTKQTQGGAISKKAEQALDITSKTRTAISHNRRKKGRK